MKHIVKVTLKVPIYVESILKCMSLAAPSIQSTFIAPVQFRVAVNLNTTHRNKDSRAENMSKLMDIHSTFAHYRRDIAAQTRKLQNPLVGVEFPLMEDTKSNVRDTQTIRIT